MADHQIDCATRAERRACPSQHITTVRIAGVTWTLDDLFAASSLGHAFHTVDPRTGQRGDVVFYECPSGHLSIRSVGEDTEPGNLTNLPC